MWCWGLASVFRGPWLERVSPGSSSSCGSWQTQRGWKHCSLRYWGLGCLGSLPQSGPLPPLRCTAGCRSNAPFGGFRCRAEWPASSWTFRCARKGCSAPRWGPRRSVRGSAAPNASLFGFGECCSRLFRRSWIFSAAVIRGEWGLRAANPQRSGPPAPGFSF